jgi:hypothetical protein
MQLRNGRLGRLKRPFDPVGQVERARRWCIADLLAEHGIALTVDEYDELTAAGMSWELLLATAPRVMVCAT